MTIRRTETYSVTIERDVKTGEVLLEEWTDPATGELHREDGPALMDVQDFEGRSTRLQAFYKQGRKHRDNDEVAYVVTDIETNMDIIRMWYRHGQVHREPGPDGSLPAYLKRDAETGVVVLEQYHTCGLLHREDGPALIQRDAVTGAVTRTSMFLDGKEILAQTVPKPTI